ncbi:MAG: hypothetical protein JNK72_00445 [Myxococcales bacterium]|nr:hypothetical protein [Myxococcales bacterium]
MRAPTLEQARAAAQRMCDAAGVTLLAPDHALRDVIVAGVALASRIGGRSAWSRDHVAAYVSVTLPGAGPALVALAAVPVGAIFAAAVAAVGADRTTISLSPAAWSDPLRLLETVRHELGHAGQIARGGLPWCLAYLVGAEARAAGEAPCYAAGMAVARAFRGVSSDVAAGQALESLRGYGLDDDAMTLASGILASAKATLDAGEDLGGVVAETLAALESTGWTP